MASNRELQYCSCGRPYDAIFLENDHIQGICDSCDDISIVSFSPSIERLIESDRDSCAKYALDCFIGRRKGDYAKIGKLKRRVYDCFDATANLKSIISKIESYCEYHYDWDLRHACEYVVHENWG